MFHLQTSRFKVVLEAYQGLDTHNSWTSIYHRNLNCVSKPALFNVIINLVLLVIGFLSRDDSNLKQFPTTADFDCCLEKIIISNWGSFETLECKFNQSNVTCLIGPGDSGKTNVIRAIQYFFRHFGSFPFHLNKKGDFYAVSKDEEQEIQLDFTVRNESRITAHFQKIFYEEIEEEIYEEFINNFWPKLKEKEDFKNVLKFLGESFVPTVKILKGIDLLISQLPSPEHTRIIQEFFHKLRDEVEGSINRHLQRCIDAANAWKLTLKLQVTHKAEKISTMKATINGYDVIDYLYGSFFKEFLLELEIPKGDDKPMIIKLSNRTPKLLYGHTDKTVLREIVMKNIAILPRDDGLLTLTTAIQKLQRDTMNNAARYIKKLAQSLIQKSVSDPLNLKATLFNNSLCQITLPMVLEDLRYNESSMTQPMLMDINQLAKEMHNIEFYFDSEGELLFKKNGKSFPLEAASGTVLHSVTLFYLMCSKKYGTLLLDEPASMWHPSQHYQLVNKFVKIAKTNRTLMCITHSASLLSAIGNMDIIRFVRPMNFTEMHRIAFRPISTDILKYITNRSALFANFVVLVEGKTDFGILSQLQEIHTSQYSNVLNSIYFLQLEGKGNINSTVTLLDAANIPWVALIDADGLDGIKRKSKARNVIQQEERQLLLDWRDRIHLPAEQFIWKHFIHDYIESRGPSFDKIELKKWIFDTIAKFYNSIDTNDQYTANSFQEVLRQICSSKCNTWVWDNKTGNGAIEGALGISKAEKHDYTRLSNDILYNSTKYHQMHSFLDFVSDRYYTWRSTGKLPNSTTGYCCKLVITATISLNKEESVEIWANWKNCQLLPVIRIEDSFIAYTILQPGEYE